MTNLFPFHLTGTLRGPRGIRSMAIVVVMNTLCLALYTTVVALVLRVVI